DVEDLAPAQRAGLASVDDRTHRVTFHHPLVRSTVVELSTDSERRAAHRGLAEALIDQPERHAWHLADATVESDEQVAGLLEQAGQSDLPTLSHSEGIDTLGGLCAFGGRPALWGPFHRALARLAPDGSTGLSLCARLFADPARATPAAVDELETMINRLHDQSDPAAIVRIGKASCFVDRMTGCREAHWRVVRDGRAGGAVASAIH